MPDKTKLKVQTDEQQLAELRAKDPDVDLRLAALSKVLASETFKPLQDQAKGFLRFVVNQALLGRADQIKQASVGTHVYLGRNFNPKIHTVVRVAAASLRDRLDRYYADEGSADAVKIELPKGSYVPVFHQRWPTVTINPFKNLNPDGDDDHTLQMIQAEFIRHFERSAQCRVQRTPLDVSGAHFEIDALCCRVGASLEVYAQIVDRPMKKFIKTFLIRDNRDNLLRLADDLYTQLYACIRETILPDFIVAPACDRTGSVLSAARCQQGLALLCLRTGSSIKNAIGCFEGVLRDEPRNAQALAGLADCCSLATWFSDYAPAPTWFVSAKKYAEDAVSLNPRLAEARASLALAKLFSDLDWEGARKDFEHAIALDDKCAKAHHWFSELLTMQGFFDEADKHARRALDLDRASRLFRKSLGDPHFYAGNYASALHCYLDALKIHPDFWMTHLFVGWAYQHLGQPQRALDAFRQVPERAGISSILQGAIGHLMATTGRESEAREILRQLDDLPQAPCVAPHTYAVIYAGLGELDKAFEWLDASYQRRIELLGWIKVDPRFRTLHADPRFAQLLERLGLASTSTAKPSATVTG